MKNKEAKIKIRAWFHRSNIQLTGVPDRENREQWRENYQQNNPRKLLRNEDFSYQNERVY